MTARSLFLPSRGRSLVPRGSSSEAACRRWGQTEETGMSNQTPHDPARGRRAEVADGSRRFSVDEVLAVLPEPHVLSVFDDRGSATVTEILSGLETEDAVYLLEDLLPREQRHEFLCWCAQQVEDLFPHPACHRAIDVARRAIVGEATDEEVRRALDDALVVERIVHREMVEECDGDEYRTWRTARAGDAMGTVVASRASAAWAATAVAVRCLTGGTGPYYVVVASVYREMSVHAARGEPYAACVAAGDEAADDAWDAAARRLVEVHGGS